MEYLLGLWFLVNGAKVSCYTKTLVEHYPCSSGHGICTKVIRHEVCGNAVASELILN